jgi:hypothetical protein
MKNPRERDLTDERFSGPDIHSRKRSGSAFSRLIPAPRSVGATTKCSQGPFPSSKHKHVALFTRRRLLDSFSSLR